MKVIVIGGGAAGFFGAIAAAENGHEVTILEAASSVLAKVRISGGGRCNVTHSCFEPRDLVNSYPRGGKALRGPFTRFQPSDTIAWFESRGVRTKTEADGRMFPTTDDSATIVNCLQTAAEDAGVEIRLRANVAGIQKSDSSFNVTLQTGESIHADRILLATGGSRAGFELTSSLGHQIVPPVPSLFTFKVNDSRIKDLPGVAVEQVECQLVTSTKTFSQSGPILVTHWGLSGPAVLKLSAWAARELFDANYNALLRINWLAGSSADQVREQLNSFKISQAKKTIDSACPWQLPKRLWKSLVDHRLGPQSVRWAELSKKGSQALVKELTAGEFQVTGKGVFKEEFVTCGGVDLNEVDFRTMESRVCPGLYFAGEILNIDGITGGFNFQNAWTTAWIAGNAM
ncbi:BaiN/RdsA family NAD(P)/FAD-dependent oxidoreductase [Gimesia fumaroli]|uniref:Tricarballylate dehydrogenase n=1 Tax=Gimesia fumaroli TaxID=2527976 RepID=A0A518IIW7_9PLAN|nr:NAD(P)/FAD-dependent oxidoreductase [Gimesia fumaroli]QDV53037.1 tricarballylate dehydrogenase [Gimesia fumaroli]